MKHIIVTTPKSEMANSQREAEECLKSGSGYYFRSISKKPKDIVVGESKLYYVEDGYVRGYGVIIGISESNGKQCDVTDKIWNGKYFILTTASSWKWINPLPMKGFQGWRYFDDKEVEVVGGWKDPKPDIKS